MPENEDSSIQNKMFGDWLREQLKSLGMTQIDLAKRIGKTAVHVRRIISGSSGTKRATVVAIAYALDVPVSEAIRAAYGPSATRESSPWRVHYDEMPPEERKEIDDYIEYRYLRWINNRAELVARVQRKSS